MSKGKVVPDEKTLQHYAVANLLIKRYGKDHVMALDARDLNDIQANIDDEWHKEVFNLDDINAEKERLRKMEWEE